jgi:hypothetical protein
LENVGKPAQDLHGTIVKAVEAEESRGKHKDVKDRLIRELSPYGQYVNPLAILSSEVYGLNLPQLETAEVEQHVSSTPSILLRDYKQFIYSKGSGGKNARTAFFQSFAESFVKKYF